MSATVPSNSHGWKHDNSLADATVRAYMFSWKDCSYSNAPLRGLAGPQLRQYRSTRNGFFVSSLLLFESTCKIGNIINTRINGRFQIDRSTRLALFPFSDQRTRLSNNTALLNNVFVESPLPYAFRSSGSCQPSPQQPIPSPPPRPTLAFYLPAWRCL